MGKSDGTGEEPSPLLIPPAVELGSVADAAS